MYVQFSKNLHDFLYENEYCGKTKNLTPEIFLYVLDKIFTVNLKKKINFWRYTFYEFQGQSKGHKVKYLKITWN